MVITFMIQIIMKIGDIRIFKNEKYKLIYSKKEIIFMASITFEQLIDRKMQRTS